MLSQTFTIIKLIFTCHKLSSYQHQNAKSQAKPYGYSNNQNKWPTLVKIPIHAIITKTSASTERADR